MSDKQSRAGGKPGHYYGYSAEQWIKWVHEENLTFTEIRKKIGGSLIDQADPARAVRASYRRACEYLGVVPRTQGKVNKIVDPGYVENLDGKHFIVTSVLNNTPLHDGFYRCLRHAQRHLNAQLLAIPLQYKNPNAMHMTDDYWWPSVLEGSYVREDMVINRNLTIGASVKVEAPSVDGLNRFMTYGKGSSFIVGHPRVQMKVLPSPANEIPRILHSTGCLSEPNYSESARGALGKFFHKLSALLVVRENDKFFRLHQLHYDKQKDCIYYKDKKYNGDGSVELAKVSGLVLGDLHAPETPEYILRSTFTDQNSLVKILKPETVVFHDVYDCLPVSHHHDSKPVTQARLAKAGKLDLQKDLKNWVKMLRLITDQHPTARYVAVGSNHDSHLDKWLDSYRPVKDPYNLEVYSQLLATTLDTGRPALECVSQLSGLPLEFTYPNDKVDIAGVDCSQHGHIGPNGARGGDRSFRKVTGKVVTGHSHTPFIFESVYGVGTSGPLNPSYRQGYTSWLHTHCVIYENGSRVLVTYIDGSYY